VAPGATEDAASVDAAATGEGAAPAAGLQGVGEPCPECGATAGGRLVAKRGRYGPFVGCHRYPACRYVRRRQPEPEPLAVEVVCPRCETGRLVARRARRTGNVFWGCSRYPSCRFTTAREPTGAIHDADAGPIGREGDGGRCLRCGAPIVLPEGPLAGLRLPGGPPDPGALAGRGRRARGGPRRRQGASAASETTAARAEGGAASPEEVAVSAVREP